MTNIFRTYYTFKIENSLNSNEHLNEKLPKIILRINRHQQFTKQITYYHSFPEIIQL